MTKEQLASASLSERERIYHWLKENKDHYTITASGGVKLNPDYAAERLYRVLNQLKTVKVER